jgi:putative transposase
MLCQCLGVSRSGFYAWRDRAPSRHARTDLRLMAQLRLAHADSRQTYGRPRLVQALKARGIAVGGNRVRRLMRAAGLRARGRRQFVVTTDSDHCLPVVPNRLRRRFTGHRLNQVWAADMTAWPTHAGWGYLAVVLDLASRRVIGWAIHHAPTGELVAAALEGALGRRPPRTRLLHHSDRGTQYASEHYRALLARHRITPSMSRTGNCWDNAPLESFFSTMKTELAPQKPWLDLVAARRAIANYIDFYNRHRIHSALGYRSPVDFEAAMAVR